MDDKKFVKSKPESQLRWVILVLQCFILMGNYYCYDIPAAIKTQLEDYMGNPGDYETLFSLLYTVYSIPNIFLPFFGGFFIDKLGARKCLIVFAVALTIGQTIFAFGVSIKSWPIMFLGRVVYGFGGESIGVGNSAILADWFAGKELAFAFGINLSMARLGSVINNLLSPALASSGGVPFAFWFGSIICAGSLFCVLLVTPIDAKIEMEIAEYKSLNDDLLRKGEINSGGSGKEKKRSSSEDEEPIVLRDALTFKKPFWVLVISCLVVYGCVLPFNNIASSLLLERDFFVLPPGECHLSNENTCQSDVNVPVDCPSSKKYQPPLPTNLTFDGEYYGELSSSDIDCSEDKWKDTCTVDYCNRQEDAFLQANTIMSIPYIISACLSPILGGFVDRYGMRAIIATVAPAVLVVVHLLMGFTDISAVGPMVGQGLAYAGFAAVLWPSVPLVVERKLTGLGYGVMTSIQNLGLAIFPLIIAAIYTDSNSEYIPNVEIFFVSLAVLGVLVGIYLNIYDLSHNNVFNAPRAKAAQYDPLLVLDDDEEVVNLNTSDRRSASRISISSADLNR